MNNPVILAVDDSKDNLIVLKHLITENFNGCMLFTAESAEKGLELANEIKLDVVLTDVQMPGMNGIEFCRVLKSTPETSAIIVLMLTAHHPKPELVAEGLNAGAFDFISKPIDSLELVARINAALRIKKAEIKLQRAHDDLELKVIERTAELERINLRLQNEIKERKLTEEALKESSQLILTVMEGTDEGVWDLDLKTGKVNYDKNWCRVLGYQTDEIDFDATWWNNQIHPDCLPRLKEAMENYCSGKAKYYETEYRIKSKLGEWIWVWSRGICVAYDDLNHPLRMIGTQRNITETRKTKEGLQQLEAAIEQVEDIIIITDTLGNIQYVNPSFERVTGYAKEEVIGLNPRILKSGFHPSEFYQSMWATLVAGEIWSGRMINKRKTGTFYDEEATITPIKNQLGDISNFIAVKRDVTQKVKMEQQLRQAQKMEAIGTLAGGIAHDFNNILFAIQGYNSLSLRLLDTSHPTYPYLQKLGQAANRAKELVFQILTFSRQSEQTLKPIQMQPVVKEALNLLRASIPTTIDVVQKINPDGGLILGDMTHVHQIIINLATNAYQAMRDTGGVLTITLDSVKIDPMSDSKYHGMKPGCYMELKVSDTGLGMDRNTMERIFEPYFSTKGQGEGTGLGLSIVHGIITSYDGKIFVESEKGTGTTFQVLIPELETPAKVETIEEQTNISELSGTERILVVDDEIQISDILKNMLEELGYSVDAYTNSEQSLSDFIRNPQQYDLIITDMTMPKLTGADLARRILEIRPSMPIILCTGYSDRIDGVMAKQIGFREFVLKPVSINVLAKVVRDVLNVPSYS